MIDHLSHSTVEDYVTCGERVYLRKVARVASTPAWALIGGSAVHAATEAHDLADFGILDGRALWTFEQFLDEATEKALGYAPEGTTEKDIAASGRVSKEWPKKEDKTWWLTKGPAMVASWRTWLHNSGFTIALLPTGDPAIEIKVESSIGDIPVVGYVDRILQAPDGSLGVVDLKAGSRQPQSSDQLLAYGRMLTRIYGEWGDGSVWALGWGCYFMCRQGLATLPADLWAQDSRVLETKYALAWKGIQASYFMAKPSALCSACGVREWCYAVDGVHADKVTPVWERGMVQ